MPAVCQFTEDGMAIIIGESITHRQGRDGLVAMMQEVADFFADTIARQPEDWHMMQPFFSDRKPTQEARGPTRAFPFASGWCVPIPSTCQVECKIMSSASRVTYVKRGIGRTYLLRGSSARQPQHLILKTLPASGRRCPSPTTGPWLV